MDAIIAELSINSYMHGGYCLYSKKSTGNSYLKILDNRNFLLRMSPNSKIEFYHLSEDFWSVWVGKSPMH